MLMPGRRGLMSSTGTFTTNDGHTIQLKDTLSIKLRTGNQPSEYKATQSIEFIEGFESGVGDEFTAYITDGTVDQGSSGEVTELSGTSVYRYGFNGKENDPEIKGEGNQQDYGMRIYDPRLGKFLSVDPLGKKYPWYTP